MKMKRSRMALVAAAATAVLTAAPVAASPTTVVTITPSSSSANFRWVRSSTNGSASFYTTSTSFGTTAGPTLVNITGLALPGLLTSALFTFSGTVTASPADLSGSALTQLLTTGSFSLQVTGLVSPIPKGPFVTFTNGMTLLTGDFNGAVLEGSNGGATATLSGVASNLSSPYYIFAPGSTQTLDFDLGNISPTLARFSSSTTVNSFRALMSGSVQSGPAPALNVPEPATWSMLIIGMGLVGSVLRRRKAIAAI